MVPVNNSSFSVTEVNYTNIYHKETKITTVETVFVLDHRSPQGFDKIVFAFRENEELKNVLLRLFDSDIGTFNFEGKVVSDRPRHCTLTKLWRIR